MNTIEFLKQYERAAEREQLLQDEYDQEALMIDAVRSLSDNDGMPHGSGISKPTEEKAVRLSEKRMKLVDAKLEAIRIRQEVFDVVSKVPDVPGRILMLKYIYLQDWPDVADSVGYSLRHVFRLHREAVSFIEENNLVTKCH